MNLPESVDDPSLLQHEPLRAHVVMYETLQGQSRSATKGVVSQFIDAMRQDDQVCTRNVSTWLKISTTLP